MTFAPATAIKLNPNTQLGALFNRVRGNLDKSVVVDYLHISTTFINSSALMTAHQESEYRKIVEDAAKAMSKIQSIDTGNITVRSNGYVVLEINSPDIVAIMDGMLTDLRHIGLNAVVKTPVHATLRAGQFGTTAAPDLLHALQEQIDTPAIQELANKRFSLEYAEFGAVSYGAVQSSTTIRADWPNTIIPQVVVTPVPAAMTRAAAGESDAPVYDGFSFGVDGAGIGFAAAIAGAGAAAGGSGIFEEDASLSEDSASDVLPVLDFGPAAGGSGIFEEDASLSEDSASDVLPVLDFGPETSGDSGDDLSIHHEFRIDPILFSELIKACKDHGLEIRDDKNFKKIVINNQKQFENYLRNYKTSLHNKLSEILNPVANEFSSLFDVLKHSFWEEKVNSFNQNNYQDRFSFFKSIIDSEKNLVSSYGSVTCILIALAKLVCFVLASIGMLLGSLGFRGLANQSDRATYAHTFFQKNWYETNTAKALREANETLDQYASLKPISS